MRKLYEVHTEGCGDFYVIAEHETEASTKVRNSLDRAEYNFDSYRRVLMVKLLSEEIGEFPKGRPFITDEKRLLF